MGGAHEGTRGERRPGNRNQDRDHFEEGTALLCLPLPQMQRWGIKGTGDISPWPDTVVEGVGVGTRGLLPWARHGARLDTVLRRVFFYGSLPSFAYVPNGTQMPNKLTVFEQSSVSKVTLKICLTSTDLLPDCGPNEKVSQGGK